MKRRYYALTALYCLGIFYLSSQSKPAPFEMPFPNVDKVCHALLYGGLCAIVSIGIHRSNPSVPMVVQIFAPITFAFCYGVTDELHQLYVPHRSFDLFDLAADTAGAVMAQMGLLLWWRLRKQPRSSSLS